MTSWRNLVRSAVVDQLVAADVANGNVLECDPFDGWPSEFPSLNVWTPADEFGEHEPPSYLTRCEVVVELFVARTIGPAGVPAHDQLDALLEAVLAVLDANPTLRQVNGDRYASSGRRVRFTSSFEKGNKVVVGYGRLSFAYQFREDVAENPVPSTVGELEVLHVEWQLAGNNDEPEAIDNVSLPG